MASPMQASDTPPNSSQSFLSKYVDKELLENEFLHCTVCFEKYDQNMRSPKLLPCSHTFCAHCLQAMVTASGMHTRQLKCPLCCTEHQLNQGGPRMLPTDSKIVQMIDFLSAADVTTGSICSQMHEPYDACHQHPNQVLSMFCKTCKILVCKDCVAKAHSEKGFRWLLQLDMKTDSSSSSGTDSKRCEVTEFAEAYKELMQKTASIKDRTQRILEKLQEKSDSLEKYSQELKYDIGREEESINRKFAEYQQILDQRRQELLVQLKTGINNSQHMMQKKMFEINSKIPTIIQLQEEFENVKKGKSFWQLRSLAERMKQWENSASSLVNCSDHDYRRCLYDTKHSDLDFPSQAKGLGEVKKTSW